MLTRSFVRFGIAAIVSSLAGCAADGETARASGPPSVHASSPEEAGHYLVLIGGCNDCHTMGWAESNGTLPQSEWLTGSTIGWRGSWGTSYAANLRLSADELTERQWIQLFRSSNGPPPMPWMNYRGASDADLAAIHHFLKSLGKRGSAAPALVPPEREPSTPYIDLTPKSPATPATPPATPPAAPATHGP